MNVIIFLFNIKYLYLDKLKEELVSERQNLGELKPKYNAYKETNKALEEKIRDIQVIIIYNLLTLVTPGPTPKYNKI